jgi:hypothetical protein
LRNVVNRLLYFAVLKRDGSCRKLGTQGAPVRLVEAAGKDLKSLTGNQLKAFLRKSGQIRHRTCNRREQIRPAATRQPRDLPLLLKGATAMIKPTSKTDKAPADKAPEKVPQAASARAAIAVQVTAVEYDTTNPAWVTFDAEITAQLESLEQAHTGLATPLSLAKKFETSRR